MLDANEQPSLAARRRSAARDAILDAAWALCRERGLGGWTLSDLARSVGLKAPSLYAYFDSKTAIYDALFRQGYEAFGHVADRWDAAFAAGTHPRRVFADGAREFMWFCTSDPARHQLLFQRVIPDFEPSAESYELAVALLDRFRDFLARTGVDDEGAVDLWTAIATGLADQQISNDPGGERWVRLVDRAVEMFCDHVGVPADPGT